jgi:hypothetical protein
MFPLSSQGYFQAPADVYFSGDFTLTAWVLLNSTAWASIGKLTKSTIKNNQASSQQKNYIQVSFSDDSTLSHVWADKYVFGYGFVKRFSHRLPNTSAHDPCEHWAALCSGAERLYSHHVPE